METLQQPTFKRWKKEKLVGRAGKNWRQWTTCKLLPRDRRRKEKRRTTGRRHGNQERLDEMSTENEERS